MARKHWVKLIALAAAIFVWAGYTPSGFGFLLPPREGPVGERHTPVIQSIAVQNEIGIGNLWKIYIQAKDPEGDIDKIYVYFAQPGGSYPNFPLVLRKPVSELKGAVLVWTVLAGTQTQSGPIYASAEVRVEDRAGNISEPKVFDFTLSPFGPKDQFNPPPPFDKNLVYGQVDFPIQSEDDLVGDDDVGRDD